MASRKDRPPKKKGGTGRVSHRQDSEHDRAASRRPWIVVVLPVAKQEGRDILDAEQYEHIVEVLERLEHWGSVEELADLDIRPFDEFFELDEKGGPLRRINLRIYFAALKEFREIVVLKTYKKEEDKRTAPCVLVVLEDRLDDYKQHGRPRGASVHPKSSRKRR